MQFSALAFLAVVLGVATCLPLEAVKPPKFPVDYFFEGMFSIPEYGIFEPITVHTSGSSDMQRIVYYGRDTFLTRGDLGVAYEIVPRVNEFACFSTNVSGPTAESNFAAAAKVPLAPFLPDLSGWSFGGEKMIRGIPCHVWEHEMKNFSMTAHYQFAVTAHFGIPVQLVMDGFNFVYSSHPDHYVLDFNIFLPAVDSAVFSVPEICKQKQEAAPTPERIAARIRANIERLSQMVPVHHSCNEVSEEFKTFLSTHGKSYHSCDESAHRESVWKKNMDYITRHNARNDKSHTLGPNRFADLEDHEFRSLMLQQRGRAHNDRATRTHIANPNDVIPDAVDWRKEGKVVPAQNQGVCGSCYSFGAVASLESVNAVKNGKLVRLSTQQVVDCSWGYTWSGPGGNLGCDGGYASAVYQWMMDNGGVALADTYRYEMQDGFCRGGDKSSGIKVVGYANVTSIPDLKHAVATVGAVAIAIDASHPSFRFYNGGIYYEPECKSDMDSLDHEIAAVGYGKADDGTEYWIVKNSWSEHHWGVDGFALMSMKDNNCGVATQANYPIIE